MKLHELTPSAGSRKVRNRVGRGTSSGNGKTSGRGQKGQKARSGGGVRLGFEGGQTPLFRRMPKRGFSNVNRKDYAVVNLETLNRFEDGAEVNADTLVAAKIVKDVKSGIKVLANGELTAKNLKVTATKASASAVAAIENNGGTVTLPKAD
ncbi:50S ribosomal protein L15 [Floricoccus penangensis]|uniref:Large ribosomal subunit protein uL15 n=1 Tax=Floricoccus penangensis TaxID=1859475 RepID=A0A9Q5P071_9LACT|nr:50S ribosomal protein L15 [Floricoccus penangensis]OFI47459.1 50S ribosomal protein L15 [Floricoccus penangensis]